MGRNAVGKLEESLEKILLGLAEQLHVQARLRPAQGRTKRHHQDLEQQMPRGIPRARIVEFGKAAFETTHSAVSQLNTPYPMGRIEIPTARKCLLWALPQPKRSYAIPLTEPDDSVDSVLRFVVEKYDPN